MLVGAARDGTTRGRLLPLFFTLMTSVSHAGPFLERVTPLAAEHMPRDAWKTEGNPAIFPSTSLDAPYPEEHSRHLSPLTRCSHFKPGGRRCTHGVHSSSRCSDWRSPGVGRGPGLPRFRSRARASAWKIRGSPI